MIPSATLRHLVRSVPKLYNVPNDLLKPQALTQVPTYELLGKLGFVTYPKPGLVHWLVPGTLIRRKLESLIREEMEKTGAEELSLSALSHATLWEKTGRWGGHELFKLKDSTGSEYCLAPTCEEEITQLVKQGVRSYKDMPLLYYQINTKFRDEKRPRSGLLRGREFLMKDAYSFDLTEKDAFSTYNKMTDAYTSIFQKLRVPFVKAEADSGDIGGSLSHEWHYIHPAGEDTLFACTECGNTSNVEKTLSFPQEEEQHDDVKVKYYTTNDENTLVCAYYPGSRQIVPSFLSEEIPDIDLSGRLREDQVLDLFKDEDTLINKKIVRIMDSRLNSRSNFPDFPINFINRSLITTLTDIPIVEAVEGELCHKCEEGSLEAKKAIEVGHTFFLGEKYSKALECIVEVPEDGGIKKQNVLMGCYGIGLSRIIAALAEINRDSQGLRWPTSLAPWEVTVINMSESDEFIPAFNGLDWRVDSRSKVGLGRKIKDSHMMGIPLVAVVGKKWPLLEIEERGARSASASTRQLHSKKTFEWEIIGDLDSDNTVKHIVHSGHAAAVMRAILSDM
ncbi:proline-tRNA_ligase [Candidozyma auris]|uniref:proline-tRNA_ligase n=1 Tax=Candidozyma auris TaxID=498019 RepID=UPI000D26D699|nr:proline-tRNA_ligase [[Candida] auris]QEO21134.1 proline-tRNA_ligase [[Candida] auris]GBL48352.1 proline--tRNA ligase [[Candida] auris]